MTLETVYSGALTYSVAFEDPLPVSEQIWAIVSGYAIDELTGIAPDGPLAASVVEPELDVNINADGSFAVVARPWFRFPPLAAASYSIRISVAAAGYLPYEVAVAVTTGQRHFTVAVSPGETILSLDDASGIAPGMTLLIGPSNAMETAVVAVTGPGASQVTLRSGIELSHSAGAPIVPDLFATTALGQVPLRRAPVTIKGRTFTRDDATNLTTPVPGATVVVTDIWRTFAGSTSAPGIMTDANVGNRAFALGCYPGAYASHPNGTPVTPVTVTPAQSDDKVLVDAAAVGSTVIHVSNRIALAVGDLLVIDADAGAAAEPIAVASIQGWGLPAADGYVTLAQPLAGGHRVGARVARAAPPATGTAQALKDAVVEQDETIFVDAIGGLSSTGWMSLTGGTAEYQGARAIQATSDANGFFQLPPLHRIASLALEANASGHAPASLKFGVDYSTTENFIQIEFT